MSSCICSSSGLWGSSSPPMKEQDMPWSGEQISRITVPPRSTSSPKDAITAPPRDSEKNEEEEEKPKARKPTVRFAVQKKKKKTTPEPREERRRAVVTKKLIASDGARRVVVGVMFTSLVSLTAVLFSPRRELASGFLALLEPLRLNTTELLEGATIEPERAEDVVVVASPSTTYADDVPPEIEVAEPSGAGEVPSKGIFSKMAGATSKVATATAKTALAAWSIPEEHDVAPKPPSPPQPKSVSPEVVMRTDRACLLCEKRLKQMNRPSVRHASTRSMLPPNGYAPPAARKWEPPAVEDPWTLAQEAAYFEARDAIETHLEQLRRESRPDVAGKNIARALLEFVKALKDKLAYPFNAILIAHQALVRALHDVIFLFGEEHANRHEELVAVPEVSKLDPSP